MNYAVYLPIWLLLLNMIIINNRKRKTILITKFFNRTEREKKEMFELAKRFIEKELYNSEIQEKRNNLLRRRNPNALDVPHQRESKDL